MTIAGSTIFGMTPYGGDYDRGVIFRVGADGSNFTLLHEFAGGARNGANPYGSLTLSGSFLYGMTYGGGDSNRGVIFRIGTDGSGYTLLHEFTGGPNGGSHPYGSLLVSGSTIYGMTFNGGDDDVVAIFRIGADGSGFTLLHEFAGEADDGAYPYGDLTLVGTTLYGMTLYGGDADRGVIFSIRTDGTGFELLHEFTGAGSDGSRPWGSLTHHDGTFYGMTRNGGVSGVGVVFALTPEPSVIALLGLGFTGLGVYRRKMRL